MEYDISRDPQILHMVVITPPCGQYPGMVTVTCADTVNAGA